MPAQHTFFPGALTRTVVAADNALITTMPAAPESAQTPFLLGGNPYSDVLPNNTNKANGFAHLEEGTLMVIDYVPNGTTTSPVIQPIGWDPVSASWVNLGAPLTPGIGPQRVYVNPFGSRWVGCLVTTLGAGNTSIAVIIGSVRSLP